MVDGVESTKLIFHRCFNCDEDFSKMKMCSKCKVAFYCSRKCQKEDWVKGHKEKCGKVKPGNIVRKVVVLQ